MASESESSGTKVHGTGSYDNVILDLCGVPDAVKSQSVLSTPRSKRDRVSSSGQSGSGDVDVYAELKEIKSAQEKMLKSIVSSDDIKSIVKSALKEMREELKKEIKLEIKNEILDSIKSEVQKEKIERADDVKRLNDKIENIEKKVVRAKEQIDGQNLDIEALREKNNKQASELREIKSRLKSTESKYTEVLTMANFNQQYSQKNNVKILNWPEKRDENLRQEFCEVVRNKTGQSVNPRDVLAIHRVPKSPDVRGPRPVILKFINTESRVAVIKHRKKLKDSFIMLDHLTPKKCETDKTIE